MKDGARIAAVIDLISLINEAWQQGSRIPADALLAKYYKERRYIGSKDRAVISKLVYYILRQGATLEWWLEQAKCEGTPRQIVLLALVFMEKAKLLQINELFTGEDYCPAVLDASEKVLVNAYAGTELIHGDMPEPVRLNYPDWMHSAIRETFGGKVYAAMEALSKEAPMDLRVNTLKTTRETLLEALRSEGYTAEITPYSDKGIRLEKREPVFTTRAFKDGWFEMQDEGSQLVASLVKAKPKQKVIDFCAGAGGKTLAIADTMKNRGRILAWDVVESRLNQMPKRLARAGVNNVQIRLLKSETDPFIKRHKETADWVLLDVPCTGSGTWRRNPDLKWRTEPKGLEELTVLQRQILYSAARLVKKGGHLVYATCSFFEEENEKQIEAFIQDHSEFSVVSVEALVDKEAQTPYVRLFPHQHGTDGFFAAVLKKG